MIWFPHWVNTSVFADYNLPKSYDYLFMGCTSDEVYPLRSKILNTMGQEPGFIHHPHPGLRTRHLYGRPVYYWQTLRARNQSGQNISD